MRPPRPEHSFAALCLAQPCLAAHTRHPLPPRLPIKLHRSEHTLAVTSVLLGMGEVNAIAVTASLDRSAKIWQIATGALLRAVTLPAGATSAALDAGEHCLYVGCADGSICEVPLVAGTGKAGAAAAAAGQGTSGLAVGGAGASGGVVVMEGHSKAVSSLSLSLDGDSLVSGSEDGSVRVWDLRSRQCMRVTPSPGRAPVTAALVIEWPDYLAGIGQATAGSGGRQGPKRPAPLAPLAKFQGAGGGAGGAGMRAWEASPLVIDGSCPGLGVGELPGLLQPRDAPLVAACGGGVCGAEVGGWAATASSGAAGWEGGAAAAIAGEGRGAVAAAGGEAGRGAGDEVEVMRQQVAELQRQLAEAQAAAERWKQLHGELHAFCTEQVLEGAKP